MKNSSEPNSKSAQLVVAIFVGEASSQRRGNRIQLGRKARQRRGGGGVLYLGQQHEAAREHAHRGLVARPLSRVGVIRPPRSRHIPAGRRGAQERLEALF